MEQLILQKFFKAFNETWPSGKALRLGRRNRLFKSDRLDHGDVAQLGERCPCKAEVEGSTPFVSTNLSVGGNDGGVALVCKTNPSG